MLFNSYIFVFLFLPITLIGYYQVNRIKNALWGKLWLIASSLVFYGFFSIKYAALLLLAIIANYFLTLETGKSEKENVKKGFFALALVFNIGMLAYFKYTDFFIDNINHFGNKEIPLLEIALPLGISFYVFGQIAYLIDVYKGSYKPANFIDYVTYMTFFPKISQGPIMLYDDFDEKLNGEGRRSIDYNNILKGLYIFALGLGKKMLLADNLARVVNQGFSNYKAFNSLEIFIAMLCYSLQIYFDFSGYCDMAVGIGKMLNIELPINFNSPYKANSIADFWQRWHMTLNKFFTRYIYIPLGGSRKGIIRTIINVLIVFAISGIWHGAYWTFILWGLLNGVFVILYRLLRKWIDKIPNVVRIPVTFVITTFLWSIFRADSISEWTTMMKSLFTAGFTYPNSELFYDFNTITEFRIISRLGLQGMVDSKPWLLLVIVLIICMMVIWFTRNTQERLERFVPTWKKCVAFVTIMTLSILSMSQVTEFIYYNF